MSEENPVVAEAVDPSAKPVDNVEQAPAAASPLASGMLPPTPAPSPETAHTAAGETKANDSIDPDAEPHGNGAPKEVASGEPPPPPEPATASDNPPAAYDSKVSLNLAILDFAGDPIAGLKYRIVVGNETYKGATCSKGNATEIAGLEPYQPLEILVRKTSGEFVSKYKGYTECADMNMCAVSPHIKVALQTDPHEGEPSPAADTPPAPPPAPATAPSPAAPTAAQVEAPSSAATAAPVAPPAGQIAGGGKPAGKEPTACRNEAGHPHASLKERTADWAKRHQIPTFGLWSWDDFKSGTSGCTTPAVAPAAATQAQGKAASSTTAAPPAKAGTSAPASVHSATQTPPEEIKKLVDIMEEQSTWQWKQIFETDKYTSAGIKVAILKKTFTPRLGKSPGKFDGRCYPSVKIGLWRTGLVAGYGDDIPAKGAGKWLLGQGFHEVGNVVSDGRWAAPGDVIVYRYSNEVEERNRKAVASAQEKYLKDKAAYDLKKAANEKSVGDARGAAAKKPAIGPEPKPPNDGNYGHIDVRTYDGYISDAKALHLPNASKFVVTGIYRKIFDPLPDLRTRAFLKILREWECHGIEDHARYFILQQKIDGKNTFSDTKTHPWAGRSGNGTFAGAYQIRLATWEAQVKSGLPSDFSPATQDMLAVSLIEGRGALGEIRLGNIANAISLLNKEWTSLPGGVDARHEVRNKINYIYTINDVLNRYKEFLEELIGK